MKTQTRNANPNDLAASIISPFAAEGDKAGLDALIIETWTEDPKLAMALNAAKIRVDWTRRNNDEAVAA